MRRVRMRGGGVFEVDPLDHIGRIMARGTYYEHDLLTDLASRVTSGTAIDVGAHIGNHAIYMARLGLDVVALEPNPNTLPLLRRNVEINDLHEQVVVMPVAAGARHDRAAIVDPPAHNSGMARVTPADDGEDGTVLVVPIDGLYLENVSVIKIDVEGTQMEVLAGAEQTIRRDRPILYVETDEPSLIDDWLGSGWTRGDKFGRTATWCWLPITATSVSVAIMAHPSRREQVAELREQLDVPPTVVWDRYNDRWDTGRRAWLEGIDPDATHGLVLQDDVIACPDLIAGLRRMLTVQPLTQTRPVSLYIGRSRTLPRRWSAIPWLRRAQRFKHSFLELDGPWWGQGVLMPTAHIAPAIAYGDTLTGIAHYDHRLALYWTEALGTPCLYTVPCLVNHRITPSLLDHGMGPGRTALLTHRRSALQVNWRTPLAVTNAPPLQYTEQEKARDDRASHVGRHDHRPPQARALGT
jgi:FkbM family methyltransferase